MAHNSMSRLLDELNSVSFPFGGVFDFTPLLNDFIQESNYKGFFADSRFERIDDRFEKIDRPTPLSFYSNNFLFRSFLKSGSYAFVSLNFKLQRHDFNHNISSPGKRVETASIHESELKFTFARGYLSFSEYPFDLLDSLTGRVPQVLRLR
jgi:hypothetical protein